MRAEPYWAGLQQIAPSLPNDAAAMGDTMSGDPATLQRFASIEVSPAARRHVPGARPGAVLAAVLLISAPEPRAEAPADAKETSA
ncbi:hypothetical protein FH608_049600 [Nonomuraea phyllanthi]|uniref:Uncharacterized protein n=1 Tax=Nonomuraea phyllanthi TaxID=2219224 RepID=A0A5C4UWI3_9ACTN|nr:hypothetical protein FH608_049600 [Nonomuraea phyllanthi]